MNKLFKSIQTKLQARTGVVLPIAAAIVAAILLILGAAVWFFYLTINKSQLQNIVNSASLAAMEGFIEGDGGNNANDVFYQKALKGKQRASFILQKNSSSLRGFSAQLGNIDFASGNTPFTPSQNHDKGGAITYGRWYTSRPANASSESMPYCESSSRPEEHRYPCFEPNKDIPQSGVLRGADAVKVEACNENPITAPFSESKQYICENSVATLVQRCVAFLVDLSYSQTFDSHKSMAEDVKFYDSNSLATTPTQIDPNNPNAIPIIIKPRYSPDPNQEWNPITNPSIAALPYYHDTVVAPLKSDPARCFSASTFLGANGTEAMYWCSMPDNRSGSPLTPTSTLHYKSDYRLRDYHNPKTNTWQKVWADVFASNDGTYLGPQPETTVFNAINAALRALEKNKTSGDRVMMLTFNKSIVSVDPDPSEGMTSDLGYLIQLTNVKNRGPIDESFISPSADGSQLHPNFIDKGWIPLYGEDYDKTNAALALDYTAAVMKQECPATSVRSIVMFSDGLANCSRHYVDANHPQVPIDSKYSKYLQTTNYNYACYDGSADDQLRYLAAFEAQLAGVAAHSYLTDWWDKPAIATVLKENSIALSVVLAGDTVAPHTIEVPVPHSDPPRFYTQDELSALGWGGRDQGWDSHYNITSYLAHYPSDPPRPDSIDPGRWAGLNIPKIGFYYGYPNLTWAGTVMDSGGTFCPIRPKCKKDGDLMHQPPCNNHCPAGQEYITDPYNTATNAPRVLNPQCLVYDATSDHPYNNCWRNDHEGPSGTLRPAVMIGYGALTCSFYDRTESEQAADCAVKTVSGNPYILVAQDEY